MIIPVFDKNISVQNYDLETFAYRNRLFKTVNMILSLPDVVHLGQGSPEQYGEGISTVALNKHLQINTALSFDQHELGSWMKTALISAAQELSIEAAAGATDFTYVRSWMNRIYKGCSGAVHQHCGPDSSLCDLTGIFYLQAPENSAELVFINEEIVESNKSKYTDYPIEKRQQIKPLPGMLVCHDPRIPHAVTEHNSDDPRTCLVFDIKF